MHPWYKPKKLGWQYNVPGYSLYQDTSIYGMEMWFVQGKQDRLRIRVNHYQSIKLDDWWTAVVVDGGWLE